MKHYKLFQSLLITMILSISLINTSISQPWLEQLSNGRSDQQPSFFDIQNAFNDYWGPKNVDNDGYYMENGVRTKAYGWKQFKRWEWDKQFKIDPKTGFMPDKSAQEIYDQYLRTLPKSNRSTISNWSNIGVPGLGRVNCIAFHPTDVNTYWIGAPSGGLWVTTNNGASWTCLTDKNGVLGVSDIIIPTDYATSKTIYIATGDRDSHDNSSLGVLKSTNGGVSWSNTGLSFLLSSYKLVTRLLLDPNNNQFIVAATTAGVYKTSNGGTTWSLLTSTSFIDMEYKPGNFNTLYGATKSGLIYFSSNGGVTWTQSLNLPNGRRIEMAVSPAQPSWVYAVVSGTDHGLYGIYKSTNSGASFTQIFSGTTLNLLGRSSDGKGSGGQGWYDLSLAVSPTNGNTIILGGIVTWKSINGGVSWIYSNGAHVDKHMHKFTLNGLLFECNDGGIYLSSDEGTKWTDKSSNLSIAQMYKLGVSLSSSDEVLTGLQDNGTRSLNNGIWKHVLGGDGMECLIDYSNASVQYSSIQNGLIFRTFDKWQTKQEITPLNAGTGAWVTPYIQDPTNPNTIYAGYSRVWKSTDRGDSWTPISNYLSDYIFEMAISKSNPNIILASNGMKIWKTNNGGSSWVDITNNLTTNGITGLKIHSVNPSIIWVSYGYFNGNRIFQSSDGGNSWTNISAGLPELPVYSIVQNTQITSETHLYVGTELGIYFKKGANNWVPFNNNLPNVKIGELEIYYNTNNPDQSKLRAATYGRGLWESNVYYESVTPSVTVPTNVLATDGTFFDKVQLTWSGTSGNFFRVYRNTTNINSTATPLGSWQTSTTYDDLSAMAGTTYYYFVRASSNSSGASMSAFSAGDSGLRSVAPVVTTPTSVDASDGTFTDKVRITWSGTSGNFFRVFRNTTSSTTNASVISNWQNTQLFFDDLSALAGTTYHYFVQAASSSAGANASNYSLINSGLRSAAPVVTTPTSVDASDGTFTNKVRITWTGTSGNFFRVFRNTTSSTTNASIISNWQNTQSFIDDFSAIAGNTYHYFVQAANSSAGANASNYSLINSGFRSAAPVVTTPSSVNASDGTYSDKVRITWSGTSGNFFRVFRNTTSSTTNASVISNWQNTQSFIDDFSAIAGTTYHYFVQAANSSAGANASNYSLINSGWRSSAPTVTIPSSVNASDGTFTDKVSLTWSGTSGNYFRVYRNTTNVNSTATPLGSWQTSTKYDDLSPTAGTTYYYFVRAASNSSGASMSGYSTGNSGWRSGTSCGTVSNLTVSQITSKSAKLSWNILSGASQYSVWYYNNARWTEIGKVSQNCGIVSGLASASRYCFAIKAVCGSNTGNFSNSMCFNTLASSMAYNSINGSNDGSESISVHESTTVQVNIFPNPVPIHANLTLEFSSELENTNTLILMNATGNVILKIEVPVTIGANTIQIPVPETPGMYICQMLTGKQTLFVKKIMVTEN